MSKPITLLIIFILNALMMILPFIFYYVFTSRGIEIDGLKPIYMIYTGIAYILSFVFLVFSILKKWLTGLRMVIIANVLIALPTKAYIGIGVALFSMLLSFTGKVRQYFSS